MPGSGDTHGNPVNDIQLDVSLPFLLHSVLPVMWDGNRLVNSHWSSFWIKMDFHWRPTILARGADVMLKLLLEDSLMNQALSFWMFSSVGGYGIWSGQAGVGCLTLMISSSSPSLLSLSVRDEAPFVAGQGKFSGRHFRFLSVPRETSVVITPSAKYQLSLASCTLSSWSLTLSLTGINPSTLMVLPVSHYFSLLSLLQAICSCISDKWSKLLSTKNKSVKYFL